MRKGGKYIKKHFSYSYIPFLVLTFKLFNLNEDSICFFLLNRKISKYFTFSI